MPKPRTNSINRKYREPTTVEYQSLTVLNDALGNFLSELPLNQFNALRKMGIEGRLYLHNDAAVFSFARGVENPEVVDAVGAHLAHWLKEG